MENIFNRINDLRNKLNSLRPFTDGELGLIFKFYPYDLIYNAAHYSSFFAGIIITLMIKLGQFNRKEK